MLANTWDSVELGEWGLDVWQNNDDILINDYETENAIEGVKEPKNTCALCGK